MQSRFLEGAQLINAFFSCDDFVRITIGGENATSNG
jgi:hypothetical protein